MTIRIRQNLAFLTAPAARLAVTARVFIRLATALSRPLTLKIGGARACMVA